MKANVFPIMQCHVKSDSQGTVTIPAFVTYFQTMSVFRYSMNNLANLKPELLKVVHSSDSDSGSLVLTQL